MRLATDKLLALDLRIVGFARDFRFGLAVAGGAAIADNINRAVNGAFVVLEHGNDRKVVDSLAISWNSF